MRCFRFVFAFDLLEIRQMRIIPTTTCFSSMRFVYRLGHPILVFVSVDYVNVLNV